MFKKWISLENHYRESEIQYFDKSVDLRNTVFEITEKLHGCLRHNTPITMSDGTKKTIQEIVDSREDMYLLGMDENNNLVPSKVTHRFNNGRSDNWYKVTVSRRGLEKGNSYITLECTDEHRFYSPKKNKYIALKELSVGDSVLMKKDKVELTPIQEDVLIGKVLGDGSFNPTSNSVTFSHSEEHEDYVDYTLQLLGHFAGKRQKDAISGYGSLMKRGRSKSSIYIQKLFKNWIVEGNRVIPKGVILSPLSLAIFYLDDGYTANKDGKNQKYRTIFAVCDYDRNSITNLVEAFNRAGFNPTVTGKTKRYRLALNNRDSFKLFSMIYPYVPSSMKYKLPKEFNVQGVSLLDSDILGFTDDLVEQEILKIEKLDNSYTQYDIETETHNYFAKNVLVHNSNHSIIVTTTGDVSFAKRSAILAPDESFYDYQNAMSKYNDFIYETLTSVTRKVANSHIQLYGELFGGGIQKGVYYGEEKQFRWYALSIDGELVSTEYAVELLGDEYKVPSFGFITYEKSLEHTLSLVDINKQSLLTPDGYTEDNLIEGVVIAPYKDVIKVGEKTLIIKKKNTKFMEKQKAKKPKPQESYSPELMSAIELILSYVNLNRLESLYSKEGELKEFADIPKYISLFIKDIFEDLNKDEPHWKSALAKSEIKVCNKELSRACVKLIKDNF